MIKLFKALKRVKMTDYDLGVLHASEGREPQKETNLYQMGYSIRCQENLSSLQMSKSK